MQRRIIAAIAAVVLAGIGAVLLYNYVNTAETRAMSSMESTDVVVVSKTVPAGTLGSGVTSFVELRQLPKIAVVPGALTSIAQLSDPGVVGQLATSSQLEVGEQVLPSQFSEPNTTSSGEVAVPSDMQLISVPVEAPRAVGSTLQPGDKVGIYVTGSDKKSGDPVTALVLRDVLVARVQGAVAGEGDDSAPSNSLIVTFALKPADAGRVVYAEENNKIWLALEPKDGGSGTVVVTPQTVLK